MREVFEPARQDLRIAHLQRVEHSRSRVMRAWSQIRYVTALAILLIDCWRLSSLDPAEPQSSPRERFRMFVYYLRHALRLLARERGFTAAAVLTLALGVGANAAVFAVVEAVLLRPLPYAESEALVVLNHRDLRTGIAKEFIAIGDYVDLAAQQSAFEALGAYGGRLATVFNMGEPFRAQALLATSGTFDALGVKAVLGRGLEPGDTRPGAAKVAILGYQMWQQRFGSDARVVGRGIRLGADDYQIVGVAPQGFHFPPDAATELILPLTVPLQAPAGRKNSWVFSVGRLKPGVTFDAAQADLTALSRRFEAQFPRDNQGSHYFAVPLRDALVGKSKAALILLLAAVGVVLMIACANVANLLLARSLSRKREMAVRLALGANRGQLASQLLAESLALAIVAGAVGVLIAHWASGGLVAMIPRSVTVPGLADVRLNLTVLAFTLGISVATALVFGLISAITVRAQSGSAALVASGRVTIGRTARRAASALVLAEVTLAIVLLVSAGLVWRSFSKLASVDPGFQADHVMTVPIAVPADRYRTEAARQAFYNRAVPAVRAINGVQAAGHAQVVPLTGNNWTVPFERSDQPVGGGQRPPDVGWQSATAGYFTALRIPLLSGRLFDERDRRDTPPVVIVSEAIEKRFFSGESAVGRTVKLGDRPPLEIVGVVGNIRRAALSDEPRADMYFSSEQGSSEAATWFVRVAAGDATRVVPDIRAAIRAIEPNALFGTPRTLEEIAGESMQIVNLALWLFGIFAAIALALAAVGIYGVMSYVIRQRTREIGTRVALGATRGDIIWLVMRQGAMIAAVGTVLGLAAGVAAARSLGGLLYEVAAWDPTTLAVAAAVLIATIMAACYLPARRAALVDPARTLAEG
jgi:putative ABC transport system permease protein